MENTSNNTLGFLLGRGPLSQIVLAFLMSIVLYIVLISLEAVYISYKQVSRTKTVIEDSTQDNSASIIYSTNPMAFNVENKMFRNLPHSTNERSGIEYSYSCYLLIKSDNFAPNDISSFRHIFHKGSDDLYPLMGPGVFVNAGKNSLRVYQNNTMSWYNYTDINDIPVGKWFHFVLLAKDNATEIYINGNVVGKISNKNSIIYQNSQNLYLFSSYLKDLNNAKCPSIPSPETYHIIGKASALISRFYYYSYALTYTEIQDLMNMGPSPKLLTTNQDKPPYSLDNWWTGTSMLM